MLQQSMYIVVPLHICMANSKETYSLTVLYTMLSITADTAYIHLARNISP